MAERPNWVLRIDAMRERYGGDQARMTFDGETHTLAEWAKKLHVMRATMYTRLDKYHRGVIEIDQVFALNAHAVPMDAI